MKLLIARILSWTCVVLLLVVAGSLSDPVRADYTAAVDPAIQYQTFQGWGTSLAWWARVVGAFPEPARTDYVDKAFDPVKGLGLNVVRYNIGGGENPQYLAPNKQFLQYRAAVPGYEPLPGKWDWEADAGQRWVLQAAIARGANQLEAFSNSPPYWMTVSGSVTGNQGHKDNLKPEDDQIFAGYLTEVTRHFHDQWGITFRDLEPLNEPSGGWSFGNGQEGCHVDRPHQNDLVKAVGAALARSGLSTTVTASDEPSIGDAVQSFGFYDSMALQYLSKINTHSYGGGDRTRLWDFSTSAGKDLWLSEDGDRDASGLSMSRRILEDMNHLHPTAWVYWQVVDNVGGWGFLKNPLSDETTTAYTINKKYYVMGNYSKFIRPGYRFIAIDDPNSLAAYDARTRTLAIVTTNDGDQDNHVNFDLSRFTRAGASVIAYRTSPTQDLAKLPGIEIGNRRFLSLMPARSVTTYLIRGALYTGSPGFDPGAYYKLINRQTGLLLEESGQSLSDFNPVDQQKDVPGAANQQWRIVGQGTGIYKLVNRHDGYLAEVGGGTTQNGGHVDLYHDKYDPPGASNQQWRLISLGKGWYEILNTNSGLALQGASGGQGGIVEQWKYSGGANQQWKIQKVE